MLNELYVLTNALKRVGVSVSEESSEIVDVKTKGLIVKRDANGEPTEIGFFDENRFAWKYARDNQFSFPIGKVTGPFYRIGEPDRELLDRLKDKKRSASEKIARLRTFVDGSPTFNDDAVKKIERPWTVIPREMRETFAPKLDENDELARVLRYLTAGPEARGEEAKKLLTRLAVLALDAAEAERVDVDFIAPLLVAPNGKKTSVVFLFDGVPSPWSASVRARLNELLVASARDERFDGVCSLTGRPAKLVSDRFPQVKVPCFQQKTAILAMNKDVPAHDRYGRIAASVCPIGERIAQEMGVALRRITAEENYGRTWKEIPSGPWESASSGKRERRDLLIVYCAENPLAETAYANETDAEYDDEDEYGDEDAASAVAEAVRVEGAKVVRATNGVAPDALSSTLRCFILQELDPGRRRVAFADGFTVEELRRSVESWRDGGRNVPEISLNVYSETAKKRVARRPKSPTLTRTVRLFQYERKGRGADLRNVPVAGIRFQDALKLMLGRDRRQNSPRRLLGLLLRRTEDLLTSLGEIERIRDAKKRDFPPGKETAFKTDALDAIALFGVLLQKIGVAENDDVSYRKEFYMKDAAYNLGRLAALVDQLHVDYCKVVRNGDVPPGLLGNATIPVFCSNPRSGLSRLALRLKPYMAWARQYASRETGGADSQNGDESAKKIVSPNLVGWLLGELGRTSAALREALDRRPKGALDDAEKAEFLLGYLSPLSGDKSNKD